MGATDAGRGVRLQPAAASTALDGTPRRLNIFFLTIQHQINVQTAAPRCRGRLSARATVAISFHGDACQVQLANLVAGYEDIPLAT